MDDAIVKLEDHVVCVATCPLVINGSCYTFTFSTDKFDFIILKFIKKIPYAL